MNWEYKREERKFDIIPEGKYRIRIKSAEKVVSTKGNDMLALQFDVSGQTRILYHYIVFLPDRPEITNRNLTDFFASFGRIAEGDFNTANWIGKTGACVIKHDTYQDTLSEKVKYFIPVEKQDDLAPWQEAGAPAYAGGAIGGLKETADDDLPF